MTSTFSRPCTVQRYRYALVETYDDSPRILWVVEGARRQHPFRFGNRVRGVQCSDTADADAPQALVDRVIAARRRQREILVQVEHTHLHNPAYQRMLEEQLLQQAAVDRRLRARVELPLSWFEPMAIIDCMMW